MNSNSPKLCGRMDLLLVEDNNLVGDQIALMWSPTCLAFTLSANGLKLATLMSGLSKLVETPELKFLSLHTDEAGESG